MLSELRKSVAPFSAVYGIGFAPLLVLPFIFSALVNNTGLGEVGAGELVTYSLVAMCVGSLGVAPYIHRLSLRGVAVTGCLFVILGNLTICFLLSEIGLTTGMLVAGLGAGLGLAAGNASAAAFEDPDAAYNNVVFLGTLLFMVLLVSIPITMDAWGHIGVFGVLSLIGLLALPLCTRLSNTQPRSKHLQDSVSKVSLDGSLSLFSLGSIAVVGMVFFYFFRDTMIWVYAERIGSVRFQFAPDTISLLFGLHAGLSLFGPLVLMWLSKVMKSNVLLLAGLALTGFSTVWVSQTTSVAAYSAVVAIWAMAHFFTYSCMMGLAARVDSSGRVVALAGGAVMAGNAIAPAIAGRVVDTGGFPVLGWALFALVLLTLLFAFISQQSNHSESIGQRDPS